MKVIIAGSRDIVDMQVLEEALKDSKFTVTEVVCGGARGADTLGRLWAEKHDIPVRMFLAQWNKYGRSAGYRRNDEMAQYGDSLIALWDGQSRGTQHMIQSMNKLNKTVFVSTSKV